MASSKRPENAEQPSGDKLENGETGPTPGKDSSGQFSGNEEGQAFQERGRARKPPPEKLEALVTEKTEPVPEEDVAEQFSGNELDEQKVDGKESVPEKNTDEPHTGEVQKASKESPKEESQSVHEDDNLKSIGGKQNGTKKLVLFIFILLGLSIMGGIGYFFTQEEKPPTSSEQKGDIPHLEDRTVQINQSVTPKDQLLIFHSFVIPFKENKQFAYISLSISFNLPNKQLKREMIEKKHQLRGIIYEKLRQEINKKKEVPLLEELKEVIIRGVNIALSDGKVEEVYITEFLAV